MSNATLVRRPVPERTTTTPLRQRHAIQAASTATATTTPVGPPSGKKWQIVNAVCSAKFIGDPSSGAGGDSTGQIINGALPVIELVGASCNNDIEQARQYQGTGATPGSPLVLEFGDEVQLFVDATQSPSLPVAGVLTFWGWEYDA